MAEGVPGGIVGPTLILRISQKGAVGTIGVKAKIAAEHRAIKSPQIRSKTFMKINKKLKLYCITAS